MIALIKLHINYVFSEKIFYFTMALFACSIALLLMSATASESTYVTIQDQLKLEEFYISEMLQMGKILSLLYVFFLMVVGYIIHRYDVLLLNVTTVIHVKTTKILGVMVLSVLFISGYYLLFLLIGKMFVPFFSINANYITIYMDLLFFLVYYTILMMVLYEVTEHLIGLVVGFLVYLLTFIISSSNIKKEQASVLYKALSRIGLDYQYYIDEAFSFYYSKGYYLIVLLSLLIILYSLRKNMDTIN